MIVVFVNPIVLAIYNRLSWEEIEQTYAPRTEIEKLLREDFDKTRESLLKIADQLPLIVVNSAMKALNRELTYRALCELHKQYCGQKAQRLAKLASQPPSPN